MTKYHQIRWRESDVKELQRVIRNYNAKIRRITTKDPTMGLILPDTTTLKEMKELIGTRLDYKREINALQRFLKRGAEEVVIAPDNEYGLKITKWQRTEMLRRTSVINKRRQTRLDEIKEIQLTSRGKKLGYSLSDIGMGNVDLVTFKQINPFTKYMNRADLKMKWYFIKKESQRDYYTKRDYALRDSFIRNLNRTYNEEDIKDVISSIKSMNIEDFVKRFREEGNTMEQAYVPNNEQYEAHLNGLKSAWIPNRS